ncbi:MAG: hypothetical protein DWQ04_02900 [Chloroflexi bacterium]|nr:MAG: hypothetical protein DWQ04_02900 [Chloroflexota bacterium]
MTIKDILEDGDSITATVEEGADDIWFFYAEAGDVVTISVAPSGGSEDMYLALYNNDVDPDLPLIEVDSMSFGATEEIVMRKFLRMVFT